MWVARWIVHASGPWIPLRVGLLDLGLLDLDMVIGGTENKLNFENFLTQFLSHMIWQAAFTFNKDDHLPTIYET
jgi:hypothetical protein